MSGNTVFILDDNDDFRESTAWLLQGAGYTVSHFGDPDQAVNELADVPLDEPCCLLLDVRMPGKSGLDVHDCLNERAIDIPVVYMTGHGDVPLAVEAMKKGALTFLEKPLEDDALQAALDTAFSHSVQQARGKRPDPATLATWHRRLDSLTCRESQILDLVVEGHTNNTIAGKLNISIKTVELHRSRAVHKLEAQSLAEVVRIVMACRG